MVVNNGQYHTGILLFFSLNFPSPVRHLRHHLRPIRLHCPRVSSSIRHHLRPRTAVPSSCVIYLIIFILTRLLRPHALSIIYVPVRLFRPRASATWSSLSSHLSTSWYIIYFIISVLTRLFRHLLHPLRVSTPAGQCAVGSISRQGRYKCLSSVGTSARLRVSLFRTGTSVSLTRAGTSISLPCWDRCTSDCKCFNRRWRYQYLSSLMGLVWLLVSVLTGITVSYLSRAGAGAWLQIFHASFFLVVPCRRMETCIPGKL